MGLFSRTEQEKREKNIPKNQSSSNVLGELSGLSLPFKKAEKNELDRNTIIQRLETHKKLPVRLLEEAANTLQRINRVQLSPKQRKEYAELLASYIYPVVLLWYEKYQNV